MGQTNSTHPIHSAARTGDLCAVRRYVKHLSILNRRDGNGMTCLHWAAQLGHLEIVREAVRAGATLDAQDVNGWTPLMHACCRGHKTIVGTLIVAGAGIDTESHDGRTALHRAATWKRLAPLDQLIEAGGNVRHEAKNKWTPLHCAAAAGDASACSILLDAGANADAQDTDGLTPADVIADLSAVNAVKQALTWNRRCSVANSRSLSPGQKLTRSSSSGRFTAGKVPWSISQQSGTGAASASTARTVPGRSSTSGAAQVGNKRGRGDASKGSSLSGGLDPRATLDNAKQACALGSYQTRDDTASTNTRRSKPKVGRWSRPTVASSLPQADIDTVGKKTLRPIVGPGTRSCRSRLVLASEAETPGAQGVSGSIDREDCAKNHDRESATGHGASDATGTESCLVDGEPKTSAT